MTDTAVYIYSLVKTRDLYGLSAMEQAVKDSPSEFFRSVCIFTSDPYDLDDAIELVTNEYWSRDFQGVQAMTAYIYIRAALYISDPEHFFSDGFRYLLQSLLPPGNLRREFEELTERTYQEMESRHEKEISESFSHIIGRYSRMRKYWRTSTLWNGCLADCRTGMYRDSSGIWI